MQPHTNSDPPNTTKTLKRNPDPGRSPQTNIPTFRATRDRKQKRNDFKKNHEIKSLQSGFPYKIKPHQESKNLCVQEQWHCRNVTREWNASDEQEIEKLERSNHWFLEFKTCPCKTLPTSMPWTYPQRQNTEQSKSDKNKISLKNEAVQHFCVGLRCNEIGRKITMYQLSEEVALPAMPSTSSQRPTHKSERQFHDKIARG